MKEVDNTHLAYLDGIRGVAALWVLVGHCMYWGGWRWFLPAPKIAVDLFMIVSGFLMNYHYILRSRGDGSGQTEQAFKFYVRRFFRIAPCYYLSLFTAFFVFGPNLINSIHTLQAAYPARWAGQIALDPKCVLDFSIGNLVNHLTFFFSLSPRYCSSTGLPDWSLGLEMQFYLLFPLLFFLLRRNYTAVVAGLTALSFILNFIFSRLPGPYPGTFGLFPEPSFFFLKSTLFLIGIMLCDSVYRDDLPQWKRYIIGVMAIFLAAIEMWHGRLNIVIVCFATLVFVVNSELRSSPFSRVTKTLLGNRFTKFLADTSYAVYLFHCFALWGLGGRLFTMPWFKDLSSPLQVSVLTLGVIFLTYPLSYIIHRTVELPFIDFGKRVVKRLILTTYSN